MVPPRLAPLVLLLLPSLALAEAPPPDRAEDASVVYERLAHKSRLEAIEQLETTWKMHGYRWDDETLGEVLYRLGDLRWDHSRAELDRAIRDHDAEVDAWLITPEELRGPEPTLDDTEVRAWTASAADRWRKLATDLPNHPRAAQAHFFLAMCMAELGEAEKARELRERFAANWPDHEMTGEALLEVGEYWFERDNPVRALRAYQRAAEHTDSVGYPFALSRIGWCWYRLGEPESAREAFVGLLHEMALLRSRGQAGAVDMLQEETLQVLATLYAESGDVEGAKGTFCRLLPERCRQQLDRVAMSLAELGRSEEALTVWRELIAEDPLARDAPSMQGRVISTLWATQRYSEALDETERLSVRYGAGSPWAAAWGQADDLIEDKLRTVALGAHRQAVEGRAPELLEAAEHGYARYLELFGTEDGAYEVRFWRAEALYAMGRFDTAADEYERVVAQDPKGKFVREAAAGAVYSIEKHLEQLGVQEAPR